MLWPIHRRAARVFQRSARISYLTVQILGRTHNVNHNLQVFIVQFPKHDRRVGKDFRIEGKGTVTCVPSDGQKPVPR